MILALSIRIVCKEFSFTPCPIDTHNTNAGGTNAGGTNAGGKRSGYHIKEITRCMRRHPLSWHASVNHSLSFQCLFTLLVKQNRCILIGNTLSAVLSSILM